MQYRVEAHATAKVCVCIAVTFVQLLNCANTLHCKVWVLEGKVHS